MAQLPPEQEPQRPPVAAVDGAGGASAPRPRANEEIIRWEGEEQTAHGAGSSARSWLLRSSYPLPQLVQRYS